MPLDPKLQKFTTAQQAIVSYDYTDIADGTGIEIFYLMNENTGGTDDYLLTPNIMYSNDVFSSGTTNSEAYAQMLDIDFDVIFNIPKRIRGNIVISIPFGIVTFAAAATGVYIIIKARHWDGTTETELGSAQTEPHTEAAAQATDSSLKTVKIPVALTHFAVGETLRITVEMWGIRGADGSAAFTGFFGHDPKDRAFSTYFNGAGTSTTEVHVPFVLDI